MHLRADERQRSDVAQALTDLVSNAALKQIDGKGRKAIPVHTCGSKFIQDFGHSDKWTDIAAAGSGRRKQSKRFQHAKA
jgi:hypothetical protein